VVRQPLANGYLSGRYQPGSWVTAAGDWRAGHDPAEAERKLELVQQIGGRRCPRGGHPADLDLARDDHPQVTVVRYEVSTWECCWLGRARSGCADPHGKQGGVSRWRS
jgi:hypothetical protein